MTHDMLTHCLRLRAVLREAGLADTSAYREVCATIDEARGFTHTTENKENSLYAVVIEGRGTVAFGRDKEVQRRNFDHYRNVVQSEGGTRAVWLIRGGAVLEHHGRAMTPDDRTHISAWNADKRPPDGPAENDYASKYMGL